MKKLIVIHHSRKKILMTDFGVSLETVQRALKFETNSFLSGIIRERALKLGGKLMQEVTTAEGEPKDGRSIAGGEPEEGGRS